MMSKLVTTTASVGINTLFGSYIATTIYKETKQLRDKEKELDRLGIKHTRVLHKENNFWGRHYIEVEESSPAIVSKSP